MGISSPHMSTKNKYKEEHPAAGLKEIRHKNEVEITNSLNKYKFN